MAGRRTYRTRAIVLDRTKLGETDLILTLLAADGSQRRAVAKGARKPGGRLAARVELFSECDLLLAEGRSLDVVSEAALVDPHPGLRGEYDRVSAASAVAELARLTCYEDAPDGFLHPICLRALTACEQAADRAHLDVVVAAYAWKVLAHGGWRPELATCCACGDEAVTYFSPAAGGALCESCAREVAGAQPVAPGTLAWLRALLGLTFDELLAAEIDAEGALALLGLAHAWAATHLDARLRAWEFYLGAL
ncbi:DNA repair protein RecO [Thermophilibacter sp. ET337]|uniref:DNA repair protein RecO n=1 Tax=Thermophilibacter sp. ET337 TaxID=2973084 RepID=UPI0021ACD461|nr:DNA repair protein RecO [Thermophilibacter sp. ET337]MCR8907475.1 DNA repair protein RecO [Thermophilibacter sp. ET337]